MSGFHIRSLRLVGPSSATEPVHFVDGLNIVAGPSDTGKTYMLQCIDHVLGKGKKFDRVPQDEPYTTIELTIASQGRDYVLQRDIAGGATKLIVGGKGQPLPKRRPDLDASPLSRFLLDLCSTSPSRVRRNAAGQTKAFSFRDLAHVAIVEEERIIAKRSPALTGNPQAKTAEQAVLRTLLTGETDDDLPPVEDPHVVQIRSASRRQIVGELDRMLETELAGLQLGADIGSVSAGRDALLAQIDQARLELGSIQLNAAELESRRQAAATAVREKQGERTRLAQLDARFSMLASQYQSDIERLDAIREAGLRLGQMPEGSCPICGAAAEHQHPEESSVDYQPEVVAASAETEARQLAALQQDLAEIAERLRYRLADVRLDLESSIGDVRAAEAALRAEVEPRLAPAVERYERLCGDLAAYDTAMSIAKRRSELATLLREGSTDALPTLPDREFRAEWAEALSHAVASLLDEWGLPLAHDVTFSATSLDVVVGGRDRAGFGKGVRALLHAAFSIALARTCLENARPCAGFVVLDSPLVVYREPDTGEDAPQYRVKNAFYRALANSSSGVQTIILENEEPTEPLGVNLITFTRTSIGRSGFVVPAVTQLALDVDT